MGIYPKTVSDPMLIFMQSIYPDYYEQIQLPIALDTIEVRPFLRLIVLLLSYFCLNFLYTS